MAFSIFAALNLILTYNIVNVLYYQAVVDLLRHNSIMGLRSLCMWNMSTWGLKPKD